MTLKFQGWTTVKKEVSHQIGGPEIDKKDE